MYPTLSPKISRVKNDLYNDAVERHNSDLWATAQAAVKTRAEAATEIALRELRGTVERGRQAQAYNQLYAACLEAENAQLRQMGAAQYLNL